MIAITALKAGPVLWQNSLWQKIAILQSSHMTHAPRLGHCAFPRRSVSADSSQEYGGMLLSAQFIKQDMGFGGQGMCAIDIAAGQRMVGLLQKLADVRQRALVLVIERSVDSAQVALG